MGSRRYVPEKFRCVDFWDILNKKEMNQMDIKEKNLRKLSYGLYLIGAMDGERPCGCIVNTVFQVTSENPIIATSINKNN